MFERLLLSDLNRKLLEKGCISAQEFERMQEKINAVQEKMPEMPGKGCEKRFENTDGNCYNQKAV